MKKSAIFEIILSSFPNLVFPSWEPEEQPEPPAILAEDAKSMSELGKISAEKERLKAKKEARDKVFWWIRYSAENGKNQRRFHDPIAPETKQELLSLGYKIEETEGTITDKLTIVSW
jgi:hypothetical protein